MQLQIPCFPISERTSWNQWPSAVSEKVTSYENATGNSPALLIFVPCKEILATGFKPKIKEPNMESPESLVMIAIEPTIRAGVMEALDRVAAREPKLPPGPRKTTPTIKPNTLLKSIFEQMADMPATVFSVTFPLDDQEAKAGTIFFLRTRFTIAAFRREMEKPLPP
jgi:hypothetical protein